MFPPDASRTAPLSPSLLSEAEELPKPPTFDPTPGQLAAKEAEGATGDNPAGNERKGNMLGSGSGAKVPKWLQKVSGSEFTAI